MPAINFKKQFTDQILCGEKRQTIRPVRENPIKLGDKLFLYTGMRTKQCRKLKEVICRDVWPITINVGRIVFDDQDMGMLGMADIVRRDGFQKVKDFFEFFERQYGLPFSGVVIRW